MTDETIVAIYDTPAHAELATAELEAAGVPASAISVHAGTGATGAQAAPMREQGFWSNLFGGEPDHDTAVYDRSLDGGSTVVSVTAPAMHLAKITEILEAHQPIDIDERASSYGLSRVTATAQQPQATGAAAIPGTATLAAGEAERIQLAEETLAIGKRVVNRGGTRIRRFVVETPVEQSVNLHSEAVTLERHPVADGCPVSDTSFTDKTIEMTQTAEEAVISKTARVYEEVGLRKEATERTETIRDTVRKEEVEIDQIPGSTSSTLDRGRRRSDASAAPWRIGAAGMSMVGGDAPVHHPLA